MKVLQVTHLFHPFIGGIETYVMALSQSLQKNGVRCQVACLNQKFNGKKLPNHSIEKGLAVTRLPYLNLKYYKFCPAIAVQAKQADYDLIHIHNIGFFSDYLLFLKWLGLIKKPIVVNTHGGIFHTKKLGWLKKIYSLWLKFILNQADLVIADSKNDIEVFSGMTPKLKLIENGLNLNRFAKIKRRAQKNRFLFFGRLSVNKRIDKLIELIAELKSRSVKPKLVIIGKDFDGLENKLKEQTRKLGLENEVEFLGEVSNQRLDQELSQAEYFISASEYEGFGINVIEAMSAGNIPLLSHITNFKDFVANGKNGFIIDFQDVKKSAQQILAIINLKALEKNRLSQEARKIFKRFDWSQKIIEVKKAYRELI